MPSSGVHPQGPVIGIAALRGAEAESDTPFHWRTPGITLHLSFSWR